MKVLILKPQDTVVLADAYRSLWDSDEGSGSEMAAAMGRFRVAGYTGARATAYVESAIFCAVDIDLFLIEFWQSLCFQEETVGKAESDASTVHGLSSTAFQVCGKLELRIPN